MRYLFECTYVYEHPEDNSGIQRVVRNVVRHLKGAQDIAACVPVMLKHGKVYEVRQLKPSKDEDIQKRYEKTRNRYWLWHHHLEHRLKLAQCPRTRHWVERIFRLGSLGFLMPYGFAMLIREPGRMFARMNPRFVACRNRYWLMHQRLEQCLRLNNVRLLRWMFWQLFRLGSLSFVLPWKLLARFSQDDVDDTDNVRVRELHCQPGDVLVLLDSSWHSDFFEQVEELKQQGLGVVAVIYDLIPLTHSQFCDDPLVKVFDAWFAWVSRTADGFIAISETISQEVRADVHRRWGTKTAEQRWYDFFHLGSELDLARHDEKLRADVRKVFDGHPSVYLMVSTIEPRKNHAYLLDAFERLWVKEPTTRATLCIIGRIGWKCAPLIHRIHHHPEFGRRLFMFNDLNDTELEYAYHHSKSLVFPSFVEGFGLPLVEAMQRGLPAMASDIPVFREIGTDFLAYFQLDDPDSLAALVQRYETSAVFPAPRTLKEWAWPGWRDSTRQLVDRVAAHTQKREQTIPAAQRGF